MERKMANNDVMTRDFSTIKADAHLKEAYDAIKKNLEGPPHAPGLVVLDHAGKYAGVLTVDDFMKELARFYSRLAISWGRRSGSRRFSTNASLSASRRFQKS